MTFTATAPVPAHSRIDTAATTPLPTLAAWTADEAAAFKFLTDVQRRLAELADEAGALAIARVRAGRRGGAR